MQYGLGGIMALTTQSSEQTHLGDQGQTGCIKDDMQVTGLFVDVDWDANSTKEKIIDIVSGVARGE